MPLHTRRADRRCSRSTLPVGIGLTVKDTARHDLRVTRTGALDMLRPDGGGRCLDGACPSLTEAPWASLWTHG